jgi:hypothetical protein
LALSSGLPVSRLVSVQVSLTTPAVIAPAINTCLLLGTSNVIDSTERIRQYASIAEVSNDFGSTTEEFLGAQMWFSQNPRPDNIFIGRWFKTAGSGRLTGATLTAAQQLMSLWTAVTNGGFAVQIDGAAITQVGTLNFSGMGNLNAVAAAITTALAGKGTMVWNLNYDRFELSSTTSGLTSAVSFLTPPTGGSTDISGMLGMNAASSGAYTAPGVTTETALTATTLIDSKYSAMWYALVCPSATDATDDPQLAAYCEAADPPHYYGVTTNDPATLVTTSTTEIASVLSQHGYNKSAVQFSNTPHAIMSYLARILTTQWGGTNTTITLMYKQQPGVAPENINTQQANTLQNKHCNVFVGYANSANLTQYGVSCSGEYTDTIIGADALAGEVQTAIFNVLYTTPTKVPQTDSGMQMLLNAASSRCSVYVSNGFLASGTWNAPGFGTLKYGDLLTLGFYVYAPSMLLQSEADRAARKAPLMQIAAKCAGAIHTADVLIFVNQ